MMTPEAFQEQQKKLFEESTAPTHKLSGKNEKDVATEVRFKAYSENYVGIQYVVSYKNATKGKEPRWYYYKKQKGREIWDEHIKKGFVHKGIA
jgi:hypothetical protein